MKKLILGGLALLVLLFLTLPAWAQDRGAGRGRGRGPAASGAGQQQTQREPGSSRSVRATERSNKGGQVRGRERARQVQQSNTRANQRRGFETAPGLDREEQGGPAAQGSGASTGRGRGSGPSSGDRQGRGRH